MPSDAELERLEHIIQRLTGDKALRDEAIAIVKQLKTGLIKETGTTAWWQEFGPKSKALSPQCQRAVDLVVTNNGVSVRELASTLDTTEETAYRLVTRANNQLHDRGGAASISWNGNRIAHTATISAIVSALPSSQERTNLS